MAMSRKIETIRARGVSVTPDTNWVFVTVQSDGVTGVGEASLQKHDHEVVDAAREAGPSIIGLDVYDTDAIFQSLSFDGLPKARLREHQSRDS